MKQINFKIEKIAAESKTYIEFNSLIEFLKETSKHHMEMYLFWHDNAENATNEEETEEYKKYEDEALERSCENDKIKHEITKQFIEFTEEVNKNGFN